MGRNNIRLVKVCIVIVCVLAAIAIVYTKSSTKKIESSFKPMVKVEDKIYLWVDDIEIGSKKFEKIGEIDFSYKTLEKDLGENDDNFSSNIYKKGTEIYKYDDSGIIIIGKGFTSLLKEMD